MNNENSRLSNIPVSSKYAGLWIAWNSAQSRIIASGHNFKETYQTAIAKGEDDPVLAKVPRSDVVAETLYLYQLLRAVGKILGLSN